MLEQIAPGFLLWAVIFLAGYYLAWILYYRGDVSAWLLVLGIAAMPPLFFFFGASWTKDYLALVPCTLFGVVQVAITWSNYVG